MTTDNKLHKKPFTMIALLFFILVGVLHVARIIYGWQVVIGGLAVPLWFSYVAAFFAVVLALMVWRENLR